MPSTKEIKTRMNATTKTMQITKAMNMVSASKMKLSEKKIVDYRNYLDKIDEITANILNSNIETKLSILERRAEKNVLAIVVTSDRGLAGPYNSSIIKELKEDIKKSDSKYTVLAIGNKAYSALKKLNCEFIDKYIPSKDEIDIIDVQTAILIALEYYNTAKVDKVVVYYNHFVNTLTQDLTKLDLLPIEVKESKNKKVYELEQNIDEIIDTVLEIYFQNVLYGVLLDAKASEHAARMTSMSSATDNAETLIKELEILYNRARQSQITLELIDIIGGSNALK